MYIISEMLKEARKEAKITQEQLAEKTGTKKALFQELKMDEEIISYLPYHKKRHPKPSASSYKLQF